jgi:hypothetical protein
MQPRNLNYSDRSSATAWERKSEIIRPCSQLEICAGMRGESVQVYTRQGRTKQRRMMLARLEVAIHRLFVPEPTCMLGVCCSSGPRCRLSLQMITPLDMSGVKLRRQNIQEMHLYENTSIG